MFRIVCVLLCVLCFTAVGCGDNTKADGDIKIDGIEIIEVSDDLKKQHIGVIQKTPLMSLEFFLGEANAFYNRQRQLVVPDANEYANFLERLISLNKTNIIHREKMLKAVLFNNKSAEVVKALYEIAHAIPIFRFDRSLLFDGITYGVLTQHKMNELNEINAAHQRHFIQSLAKNCKKYNIAVQFPAAMEEAEE